MREGSREGETRADERRGEGMRGEETIRKGRTGEKRGAGERRPEQMRGEEWG